MSGWEADIGLTWFTAFASLTLMMGIAVWLSKRPGAALLVVVLAAATSLRITLSLVSGSYGLEPFLASPNGFAGWLFQSAWVPQHLMSASCVVAAMVFIVHFAQRPSVARLVALILLVVAGYESSTYVGGVTFAAAALVAAPILLAGIAPARRIRFAVGLAVAAVLALALAAPFILDQLALVAARGDGRPITMHHFEVLGDLFAPTLRRALDAPAYWLILLPLEFPATFIAGTIALVVTRRTLVAGPEKMVVAAFIALAGTGLFISWLLVGTLGDNNDLGLRAVLPAAMILIVAAAAAMLRAPRRSLIAATALVGLVLSLPDTAEMIDRILPERRRQTAKFSRRRRSCGPRYVGSLRRPRVSPIIRCSCKTSRRGRRICPGRSSPTAAHALPVANWRSPLHRCRRSTARRSMRNSSACLPGRPAPAMSTNSPKNSAAMSSSSCHRTAPGLMTRSPQVRIIDWRNFATAGGGFMWSASRARFRRTN